ncbi:MAG TPA: plastocyanin/azurin family copper-binding protein [Gemmatimonadaceae bacterium]|nr:plastocyanin/azurin family copper-binding protein [Gemmatimonadaceae bacterium]
MRSMTALVVVMLLAGCGGKDDPYQPGGPLNPGPNQPLPGANEVSVQDNAYNPQSMTVAAGTTVTWVWSNGYSAHSVTFADGVNSASAKLSGSHQRTFSTAGTYNYSCSVHGSAMSGSVVVTP